MEQSTRSGGIRDDGRDKGNPGTWFSCILQAPSSYLDHASGTSGTIGTIYCS